MCIRDRVNTPVSTEIKQTDTSISTNLDSKSDESNAMIQLLLKLNQKLDAQKIDSDIKFKELKIELKTGHDKLIQKCDQLIIKLDNLNVVKNELETQKVSSSNQQNAVLNRNLFKNNNNSSNEGSNSDNISSKIVVVEKDTINSENIMNDSEIFEFMKSERKFRESILVQGVQRVEFSFNVVLGRCV